MILGPRIRLGFGDILNTDRVIMRTNKITSNLKAPFFAAGTDEVLLQDFDRISHTGRFSERPVLVGLVNFIVGKGGGANRDSPLLELCYLVYAIRILSNEPSKQDAFFLGLPICNPRNLISHLHSIASFSKDGIVEIIKPNSYDSSLTKSDLKQNEFGLSVIGFKGHDDAPKIIEFIKTHINTDKIYKQVLHKKIMMLYEALGWDEPTDASKNIERFF